MSFLRFFNMILVQKWLMVDGRNGANGRNAIGTVGWGRDRGVFCLHARDFVTL